MMISRTTALISVGLLVLSVSYSPAQQEQTVNDEDIVVSSFEEMIYPAIARAAGREGTVVVEVKLDKDGYVVSASAISGSKMLIPDTLSNVRKWRFHPNSQKTAVVIYEFHLVEGKCNAGRTGLFVLRGPNVATVTTCYMEPEP
ncbi:MAG: energy transducer TonB [Candidatus Sulfotelmatobacter sp.]